MAKNYYFIKLCEDGNIRFIRWAENYAEAMCNLDTFTDTLPDGRRAVLCNVLSGDRFKVEYDEVIGTWK